MRYFQYWIWGTNDVLLANGPHSITVREDIAAKYRRWGWIVVQQSHAEVDL